MSRCRSCDASLVWATTVPKDPAKTPSKIPLDEALVAAGSRGALACVPGSNGAIFAYGLSLLTERISEREKIPLEDARAAALARYPWRVAHFTTCPDRDTHRRPRG